MKKYIESYAFLLSIVGVILGLDQWTKWLVRSNLELGESWKPLAWLDARIVNWKNTGAAFGMLQNFNVVFAVLAVVISIAIIYYYPRIEKNEWPLRVALAMQMGGALGNLIDRLTQGFVTDFIALGRFAVFNVADSSISVGVAVLVIGVWLSERQQARKNRTEPGSDPSGKDQDEQTQVGEQPPSE